jgi:hypothetical protein
LSTLSSLVSAASFALTMIGCQGATHWLGADFVPDGGGSAPDAARDPPLPDADAADDPERAPYLSWTFDDPSTTVAKDVSGNGRDGELRNVSPSDAAPSAREDNARGTFFNGTGSTASVAASDLAPTFTVALWIKPADLSQAIVLTREDMQGRPGLRLSITAAGAFALDDGEGSVPCADTVRCAVAERATDRDAWLHVAVSRSDDALRLYLAGVEAAGVSARTGAAAGGRIVVGATQGSTVAGVRGVLDELVIYGRALSDTEVGALATSTH